MQIYPFTFKFRFYFKSDVFFKAEEILFKEVKTQ